jgi:signal transduction histidine kinase
LNFRRQIRVLIVEGREDDRQWIAKLLREGNAFESVLDEADSVTAALAKLSSAVTPGFDLCIADWELPDGEGLALAQDPRVIARSLPVVIITRNERPELGPYALGEGAADFLPKDDLTPRALSRACIHALTRSRLERQLADGRRAEVAAAEREHEARVAAELALSKERQARERLGKLHALSTRLGDCTTTREIAAVVVEQRELFEGMIGVSVYAVSGETVELLESFGIEPEVRERWSRIPLSVRLPIADAARTRRVARFENAASLRRLVPMLPEHIQGSWLAIPLLSRGVVLGVLGLRFEENALPAHEAFAFVEVVAQNIAQAFQRALAYEELRLSAEFEERLLAVVGHDLRTPLSAVTLVAEALQQKAVEPELVARLERSAKRMAELISDVLDRASVRSGVASGHASAVADVEHLVKDQVDELHTALPGSAIRLELECPVQVGCEPARTSQIVANLVRNAVQHGQPGAQVTVRLTTSQGRARVSVHNLGAPIPQDELPTLFSPFKRGSSARGLGSGLGLFIVHECVTSLAGQLAVVSNASGTTFSVILPEHAAPMASKPQRQNT